MRASGAFEQTYGVSIRWPRGMTCAAIVLVLVLAAGMSWPPTRAIAHWTLTSETGPIELATFAAFLAAAVLSATFVLELRRRAGPRRTVLIYTALAALSFLASMEEISWGQSWFDFDTPRWLDTINAQGETNVHNLEGLTDKSSAGVLAIGLLGLIGSLRRGERRGSRFEIPRVLGPLFALIVVVAAVETVNDLVYFGYVVAPIVGAVSEVIELALATACLLVACLNRLRLRREWSEATAPGGELDLRPNVEPAERASA